MTNVQAKELSAEVCIHRLRRWCFWKDNPCQPGRADPNCAPCEAADFIAERDERIAAVEKILVGMAHRGLSYGELDNALAALKGKHDADC